VLGALKNYLAPAVIGVNPSAFTELYRRMDYAIPFNPSAKAAIYIACHDLVGKGTRRPLYDLIGGRIRSDIEQVPEILFTTLKTF